MAHGKRASIIANSGREYWGTRPYKGKFPDWGRKTKNSTHRLERREKRKEERNAENELE